MVKRLPCAISEEDFVKLIENTKKEEHKLAFLLGYGSGLRVSEIIKLKPQEVNFKEKRIFIKSGKGEKDRVVPMPKGFKDKHLSMLPFKIGVRALEIAFKNKAREVIGKDLHFHSLGYFRFF